MATSLTRESPTPTIPEPSADHPPAHPLPWRRGAAVLMLLFVLVGLALSRPAGSIRADHTEHSERDTTSGRLTPESPVVSQVFIARDDRLASLTASIGTYQNSLTCSLRLSVLDSSGTAVASTDRSCHSIQDTQPSSVARFDPPIADSRGRSYELRAELLSGESGPTFWSTTEGDLPRARMGEVELPVSLEVTSEYEQGKRGWDLLGTFLRRASQYGPFWQTPAFVAFNVLAVLGLLVALSMAPRRRVGAVLVALSLGLGTLWATVIPTFGGPDEPAHAAYAQILAERHLPLKRATVDGLPPLSPEIGHGSSVFNTGSLAMNRPAFDESGDGPDAGSLAAVTDRRGSQSSAAAGYSPAYYVVPALLERFPGRIDQRLGYMRMWSVVLGAATVWLTYRVGLRLFPRHADAATLLAVSVALQPMLTHQMSVVNNDAGLIAGGALCLLLALQFADRRQLAGWPAAPVTGALRRLPPVPLAFWAGIAAGLTWLAKPSGAVWIGVLGVAWLIGRLRRGKAGEDPWWRDLLLAGGGVIITYGLWYLFEAVRGYPAWGFSNLAEGKGPRGLRDFYDGVSHNHFDVIRTNWVEQFWGNFSWVNVPLPNWAYGVTAVFSLVLAVSALAALVHVALDARHLRSARRDILLPAGADDPADDGDPAAYGVLTGVCLLAVAATAAAISLAMWQYFHHTGRFDFVQGRYGLMMLPALLAMPALVLRRFVPRLSPVVPLAVTATAMTALHVLSLGQVVNVFYL